MFWVHLLSHADEKCTQKRNDCTPSVNAAPAGLTDAVRVVAVDWSGDATVAGQRKHIWVAVARQGRLVALRNGRDRRDVTDSLIGAARRDRDLVVGLDFSFSFPAWFFGQHGLEDVASLWDLASQEGERWLRECQAPFWGRP